MKKDKKKFINSITCFVFVFLIFSFTILSMTNPVKTYSENENRKLAQKPEFSLEEIFKGDYTSEYETFITDQFVFRDSWIGLKTISEIALQKKELNGVYLGKGDYLIETHPTTGVDYDQMIKNVDYLVEFSEKYREFLGDERVKMMLVPTASSVLEHKLPAFADVFDQIALIRSVEDKMADGIFVDVSDVLKSHSEEYIFYRTDHHWTSKGAYYAYTVWAESSGFTPLSEEEFEIIKASDDFRGTIYSKLNLDLVTPDEIDLYKTDMNYKVEYNMDKKIKDTLYEMSHLDTKDQYSVFMNGNNAVVQVDTELDNGRKLLIIKDSYAHCFAPFAVNHYETTYMVDFRYFNMNISDFIEQQEITDVLVLYNVKSFISDQNVYKLTK